MRKRYIYRKFAVIMYIHEMKGWPNFIWNSHEISVSLGKVRYRQGIIFGQMQGLGFKLREETMLNALTLDVTKSSEIEGEILNPDQVRSSLAQRLGIENVETVTSGRNVEGIVEMMLDATQNYKQALTEERLFNWHAALFPKGRSGIFQITVGGWRDGEMQVTSGPMGKEIVHFEAPASEKVSEEMEQFLKWLEADQQIDAVLKAAIAHLWFVTIHPFDDGNGRIARAIADLQLAHADKSTQRFYSMSAQIQAERKAYYDILESTQNADLDITAWLKWFLDCLMRSMDQTETTIAKTLNRARFWDKHHQTVFNSRQQKIIQLLHENFFGMLQVSKYAKINKTSSDTALRDLQDLVRKGVLLQVGSGRSTHYILA